MTNEDVEYYNILLTRYQTPVTNEYLEEFFSMYFQLNLAYILQGLTGKIRYNYIPSFIKAVKEIEARIGKKND